jgi:hypothetical protein
MRVRTFKIDVEGYSDWTIEFRYLDYKTISATSIRESQGRSLYFVGRDMGHKNWVFSARRGFEDSFVTDFISINYADWASGSKNTLSARMIETTEGLWRTT